MGPGFESNPDHKLGQVSNKKFIHQGNPQIRLIMVQTLQAQQRLILHVCYWFPREISPFLPGNKSECRNIQNVILS